MGILSNFLLKLKNRSITKEVRSISKTRLSEIIKILENEEITITKYEEFIRFIYDDKVLFSIGDDFILCFWFGYNITSEKLYMLSKENDRKYIEDSEFKRKMTYYIEEILKIVEKKT